MAGWPYWSFLTRTHTHSPALLELIKVLDWKHPQDVVFRYLKASIDRRSDFSATAGRMPALPALARCVTTTWDIRSIQYSLVSITRPYMWIMISFMPSTSVIIALSTLACLADKSWLKVLLADLVWEKNIVRWLKNTVYKLNKTKRTGWMPACYLILLSLKKDKYRVTQLATSIEKYISKGTWMK